MKFTGTLSVPDLGIEIPVQVDLEPLAAPVEPETLTDAELRSRWQRSGRTLKRLRDSGRLAFLQVTPRRFLYKLSDVREYESENYRGANRRAVRKPGRGRAA